MPVWQGASVRRALLLTAVAALASVGTYAAAFRHRQFQWGATSDEVVMTLPGDDLLGRADLVATRAITVRAEVEDVWPWLAQMGQGRGGLYSYDWVENLVGCHVAMTPTWNETAIFADYVLPFGHSTERHDTMSYEQYAGKWLGFRQPVRRVALEKLGEKIGEFGGGAGGASLFPALFDDLQRSPHQRA